VILFIEEFSPKNGLRWLSRVRFFFFFFFFFNFLFCTLLMKACFKQFHEDFTLFLHSMKSCFRGTVLYLHFRERI
jgi:hypothetical protein